METEKCNSENKEMASKLWNGKRYCIEHYNEFIWEELICHYNNMGYGGTRSGQI